MNTPPLRHQTKRLCALVMSGVLLVEMTAPAFGAASQSPPTYVVQPDPNVMFTLDDSNSMVSDVIPDLVGDSNINTLPNDANSSALSGWGARFPNMWGSGSSYLSYTYYNINTAAARYLRSSAGNPLYYNPAVTYRPWPLANDNTGTHPNASITAVNIHPVDPFNTGRTLDITQRQGSSGSRYWLATHFVYNGTTPMPQGQPFNALNISSNFTKVEIRSDVANYARAATRTDCTGAVGPSGCTYAQEIQNFANWLQYYRTRMLMTKGGIATAFSQQGTNLRVGFGTINTTGVVRANQGIAKFTGPRRQSFFTDLYGIPNNDGGTPLLRAMNDVGQYFMGSGSSSPYAESPGVRNTPEYSCRRNFHILSSDGYWNGATVTLPAQSGSVNQDWDDLSGQFTPRTPEGNRYAFTDNPATSDPQAALYQVSPFRDSTTSNTSFASLSDIASYYWATDLRQDLTNNVPQSRRDSAFWQHLTQFTVGLGINGSGLVTRNSQATVPSSEPATSPFRAHVGKQWLANETMRDLLVASKTSLDWPRMTSSSAETAETGDDLIRAAMVSRGRYFSATDPTTLSNGLITALQEATDTPLSQSNLAVFSQELRQDGTMYQATFSPMNWYGRLYAFSQGANGIVVPNPDLAMWEASSKMPAPNDRSIYTWTGSTAVPFTWNQLTSTQRGHLNNDENVLHYLRGDGSREIQNGGSFRDRTRYNHPRGSSTPGVLGNIVNSSPVKGTVSGASNQLLPPGTPGRESYAQYRSPGSTDLNNLINTIFVGANDGMLHAFNASTGVERFAYVPASVFDVPRSISGSNERKLLMLSEPTYQHRFTVDGSSQLADAFVGPDAASASWRTFLIGSTGAGARSIFAMDVTDPAVGTLSTSFGPSKIKWEFSESHELHGADMGHILSYGHVARMANGQWAVIFGNGYDSLTGRAALFILDLWSGEVIRKIPVGPTPGASERKNGLSQPNFTMHNRTVQYIYAGDLYGRLWKFDVTSEDPNQWAPSFGSAPNYAPLYTTPANQPITVMPALGLRVMSDSPNHRAPIVIFGTGQLWEQGDTSASSTENINIRSRQSIYGIYDKPGETTGISGVALLQRQTISSASGSSAAGLTASSTEPVDYTSQRGWYLELNNDGERVHVNPQIPNPNYRESPVLVVANTPAPSIPCTGGGAGRVFALDPYSGGQPRNPTFDADGSGVIDGADAGYNIISSSRGILSMPVFQSGRGNSSSGTSPSPDPQFYGDGRAGANAGGREDSIEGSVTSRTPCGSGNAGGNDTVSIGVSDTSIDQRAINLSGAGVCKGRISWRQIQ